MLLRELFNVNEAISLTTEKHKIHNAITKLGKHTIGDLNILSMDEGSILFKNLAGFGERIKHGQSIKMAVQSLTEMVYTIANRIEQETAMSCSDIIGIPIHLYFRTMEVSGSAGYNYIDLNIERGIYDKTMYNIVDELTDEKLIIKNDDGKYVVSDINDVYQFLESVKLESLPLMKKLVALIPTIVHELVHIKQHDQQSHRKEKGFNTEYRSKLSNKADFNAAMHRIVSGNPGPDDEKLYRSSLQEIPAYAHNSALEIIRTINFPSIGQDLKSYQHIILDGVEDLINITKKITSNDTSHGSPLYISHTLKYYNDTFNKPKEPMLYDIYKRFIKVLYQELTNYIKYWQDQLPKQAKTYSYDIYLGNELIDTVYNSSSDKNAIKQELIDHDGYDPNIKVVRTTLKESQITEVFDKALPYEWTTQIPNDRYVAKFMVGDLEYRFSAHIFKYDDVHGAEISFCLMDGKKCRIDNTGTGNPNAIYATVIAMISEVANVLKISRIAYEAGDEQRKRIYPVLIKKALPGWKESEVWGDYYYYDKPSKLNEGLPNAGQFVSYQRLKALASGVNISTYHIQNF
jgi:hypothetical protein